MDHEGQWHVGIGRYSQQRVKGIVMLFRLVIVWEEEEHVAGKRDDTFHCVIRTPTRACMGKE